MMFADASTDTLTQILQVPLVGAIVIIVGFVVRYLFNKVIEGHDKLIQTKTDYETKIEGVFKENNEQRAKDTEILKQAISIFEARKE